MKSYLYVILATEEKFVNEFECLLGAATTASHMDEKNFIIKDSDDCRILKGNKPNDNVDNKFIKWRLN